MSGLRHRNIAQIFDYGEVNLIHLQANTSAVGVRTL